MARGIRMAILTVGAAMLVLAGCGRNNLGRRDAGAGDAGPESGASEIADALPGDGKPGAADALLGDGKPGAADALLGDGKPGAADALPGDGKPGAADALPGDGKPGAADALLGDGKPDTADALTLGDTRATDAPSTDVVAPAPDSAIGPPDLAPLSCAALQPLVDKGLLTNRHVRQVLFAPDGKSLLLQVLGGNTTGNDEALLVSLPGGEQRTLATGILGAEWLGRDAVLLTMADSDLQAVSLGGDILCTVPGSTCSHVAAPDGSRIYYTHDCDRSVGVLSVIDIASGSTQQLGSSVLASGPVMSPGSQWAAFIVYASATDASASMNTVYLVEKGGTPYAVPIPESAWAPVFLSDEILLVQSYAASSTGANIWRHRPGTSDATLLAEGEHGFAGYESNADRSGFLLAKFPSSSSRTAELHLVSVKDGSLVQLAPDLMDYRMFEMAIQAFAIAPPSQRVIYIADRWSDAGRSYGMTSVSQNGKDTVQLAANASRAVVSPYADRVAVITSGGATYAANVVSPTTGVPQFSIQDVAIFQAVSFVPGDRGLLFVDKEAGTTAWRLRHLSFATGAVTALAEWNSNKLVPYSASIGLGAGVYPIDPSGCFAPVDSDLDQPGTRLVLLPE
jgi:hypothetical protein